MELSILVEGQMGLTWAHLRRLAPAIEELGFGGYYQSDHFIQNNVERLDALETFTALTYVATATKRVKLGTLAAPFSFRNPAIVARQAAALQELSGGRLVLGLGSGWNEAEHAMFGFELGDVPTRLDRMEEGLEVVTRLLRSPEPVSFSGRFYRLESAYISPQPAASPPAVMVGGKGARRILPMTARYADVWNGIGLSPAEYRERNTLLDRLLAGEGRRPEDVRRTMTVFAAVGRSDEELAARFAWFRRRDAALANVSPAELVAEARAGISAGLFGAPDEVAAALRAYGEAGAAEVMVHWMDMDDIEGLELLASEVMPRLG